MEKKVCIIADPADAYATGNVIRVDVDTEIKNMKRELWYLDEWQQEMIDQECPAEEFLTKNIQEYMNWGMQILVLCKSCSFTTKWRLSGFCVLLGFKGKQTRKLV